MREPNPQVANILLCDVADTAAQPSIIFGGGDSNYNSGTGLHGSATAINFSVAGSNILSITASGLSPAAIIVNNLTANRAVVSDGSKQLISSVTTLSELAFVSGVTSAIQTQLDAKAPLANPTFSANIRVVGNIGVGNSAAATTPGSVVKKIEIFDASGTSLGFIAVYDAIS